MSKEKMTRIAFGLSALMLHTDIEFPIKKAFGHACRETGPPELFKNLHAV